MENRFDKRRSFWLIILKAVQGCKRLVEQLGRDAVAKSLAPLQDLMV